MSRSPSRCPILRSEGRSHGLFQNCALDQNGHKHELCTQDHTLPHPPKTLPVCDIHTAALCSPPKTILRKGQNLHMSTPFEEKLHTGCLKPPGMCHHMQKQSRRKEGGQRTASGTNASLPRAQETRWQQQTGVEGRSVRPRRRESRKTARQSKKEIIRLWEKTTECAVEHHKSKAKTAKVVTVSLSSL